MISARMALALQKQKQLERGLMQQGEVDSNNEVDRGHQQGGQQGGQQQQL
jgi:hypothetical protein